VSLILTLGPQDRSLDHLIEALDGRSQVVVVAEDLVVPQRALAPITEDPFAVTTALVAMDRGGDLLIRHHRVVSAGTSFHEINDATHRSVGAVVISPRDALDARAAVDDLRSALTDGALSLVAEELVEAVVVALVRYQVPVRGVEIVDVPWFRSPADGAAARAVVDSVSDRRITGLLANRVDDGFYSTFVVRRVSKPLTRIALNLGMSPNLITFLSFLIGIGAALCFATGQWPWLIAGALLLQLSLIVDCVDGEVARATRKFTALGAWLDASTDRVKEFAAYAGLAIGATRMDTQILGVDVWWIAIALIVLQTTRHVSDYDFALVQRLREATVPAASIREPSDGRRAARGGLSAAMDVSARMNRRSAVRWFKKVIHMPIGERWLLISVLAVVAGPAWALGGLLMAGVFAMFYVLVGRIARTLTWSGITPVDGVQVLRAQLDAGPIAALVARLIPRSSPSLQGRFGWGVTTGLRVFELGVIALIVVAGNFSVIAFWIVFAIAYHHYDVLYRSLQGAAPPRWLTWLGFGWDGRLIVIVVVAITAVWEPSLMIVLTWWVLWFAGVASVQWLRSSR
jgi:hypothetical protein